MKKYFILIGSLGVLLFAVGCSSAPEKMTASEEKAFKGGPMPPGTWDKIKEAREKFAAEHPAPGQPGTPTVPQGPSN